MADQGSTLEQIEFERREDGTLRIADAIDVWVEGDRAVIEVLGEPPRLTEAQVRALVVALGSALARLS